MRAFPFVLATLAISAISSGQSALMDDIRGIIRDQITRQNALGMNVMIRRHDQTIFSESFGYAEPSRKRVLKTSDTFALGSTGQMFTAVAALFLSEKGRLSLDEPVEEIDKTKVTARQLLAHTTGLYDFTTSTKYEPSPDTTFKELKDLALGAAAKPGDTFVYSESDNLFLTRLVEKIASRPINALVKDWFFDQLHMTTASTDMSSATAKGSEIVASKHEPDPMVNIPTATFFSAQFVASVDDLAKWDHAIRKKLLLKSETWKSALTAVPTSKGFSEFGLGFDVNKTEDLEWVGREGGLDGYSTCYVQFPKLDVTIIVLCNTAGIDTLAVAKDLAGVIEADDELKSSGYGR